MKSLRFLLAVMLPVLAFSCNEHYFNKEAAGEMAAPKDQLVDNQNPDEGIYAVDSTPGGQENKVNNRQLPPSSSADWDKKIIRNATISMGVNDYKKYSAMLQELVKKSGGFISGEEQNQSTYKIENKVTLRVPVSQFDEVINGISAGQQKIIERRISAADVTGEVVDTRSRLEAKRQVRLRYLELLKQARNMEEVLAVQREINEIQVQIEAAAGRVDYLSHASAMSTIELTYFQILDSSASERAKPSFGTRLVESLNNGTAWLAELLIIVFSLWPVWVSILIGILLIRRNRSYKNKTAKP